MRVRVPATSANLGPGFDALGLALALYDDVEARILPAGLSIEISGEGEDLDSAGRGAPGGPGHAGGVRRHRRASRPGSGCAA